MMWNMQYGYGYGMNEWLFKGAMVVAAWELVWKGIALWRASKRDEKWWFIGLLIVNSAGILPIAYLLLWDRDMLGLFAKKGKGKKK